MYELVYKSLLCPSIYFIINRLRRLGGERGIRTPDTLSGTSVFKTDAINHSASSPLYPKYHPWKNQAVRVPTAFLPQPQICRARAGSRSAPLPAFAASSSESVPVLSAKSTVPRESLTISSAGWFFTNPSGGVWLFADVFFILLPPASWMRNSALVPKTGQTIPFRKPFRDLPLSPTFPREYICR